MLSEILTSFERLGMEPKTSIKWTKHIEKITVMMFNFRNMIDGLVNQKIPM